MRRWLWQRLGWASTGRLGSGSDRVAAARTLAWLYLSGATIALLVLLLPHGQETSELGIGVLILVAYAVGAAVVGMFDRLALWALAGILAIGTLLISGAIYFAGVDTSAYAFFYVWVSLYASYFFGPRLSATNVLFIGMVYATVLVAQQPAGFPADRWAITLGTLVVVGGLVSALRTRIERLIATLSEAARTDALTGLRNRRGFQELLEVELERSRRSGRSLTILLADIDHFKSVNDRLGHLAGDDALVRVAGAFERAKRLIDASARIGGEEFALIAPECDEAGAYSLAERLRTEVRNAFLTEPAPLTVSVGVGVYPTHGVSAEGLLHAADEALYAAKALGRDRSVLYSHDLARTLGVLDEDGSPTGHQLGLLLTLAEVLDLRVAGTSRHSQSVARFAELAARAFGLPPERVERVRLAGMLHDIGKIGIPDSILLKPGPLTDVEWAEVRRHPEIAAQLLAGSEFDDLRPWIAAHHERPDGCGYPEGLTEGEISLEAGILAVADAYEAMVADRIYRPAIGHEAARAELERGAGTQFDGRIVKVFLHALGAEKRKPMSPLREEAAQR